MLKTLLLVTVVLSAPLDCIMTPVKQHVHATQYIIVGTAETNLDSLTPEGREYREFLRAIGRQDSLRTCVTADFRINEVVKGGLPGNMVIEVASGRGETPAFLIGSRYVLFLSRIGKRFVVNSCSYSSRLTTDAASTRLMQEIYKAR